MITLVLLSLLSNIISEAAPTYQYHYCSNETFTPNSTYQSNLNLLLSSLSSNSSIESGFYNITVGQNSSNNTIYGLFLWRGDVTTKICQDCVTTATKNTVQQTVLDEERSWYGMTSACYATQNQTPSL